MGPEDQTLAPKTREEEDTDTAMAATSENSKAAEPNSPDSRESQQKFELQKIESQLASEPSNYDVHVQYIRVLRKMGEIEKLRQAREAMNEIFPLTPVMWQEWARDEASISTGPGAFLGIEKIYERGVSDYLSVSLWCDYLRFVQEYDPSVREFSPDGIAKARNLFELAIAAAGLHVAEGSKIWEAYRKLEQAILHTIDETNIKEKEKQVQRIRNIFHCQLSVPLASLRSTLLAYKSWEVELGPALDVESGDLDGIPSTVASAYQKALEMYNARADFEEQISKQDISDSEKFQQFAIYLKFEQSYGDLARVQVLYERAITEFPVSSDLWLDYTRYLDKTLKVGNIVRYVHSKARKNCPWVGDLWVRSLLALERCRVPEKEISTVFEKSLLCTFWTIEEYLNLFLTRVDGLRRRILLPGAEEDALNFSLIRETFQRASDYLSQQMKNTDGLLHLYAYWARLELNLGNDQAAARGVWESLVKICGSMLEAWQGYIAMEIELGHLNEARSIYRRCCSERFSGTGSEDICHNWLRFEREYGTLTDFDHAAQQVTTCLEELQLFRLQQEAKYVPELIDQKEKSYKQSVNGNSKTDSNMTDEESPAKRQKNTTQNLKKVHGKEKGQAQNLAEEKEVEEAKSKFEEHPNDQHIEDSSTGRAKVNIDEFIAVVVNLDFRATSEDLKKFFSDVGGVESVRILVDTYSGKSRGLAYVHFANDAHLAAALGKNKQMFFGRKVSIAGGKRKRRDSTGHWASGEHTVPGQKYSEITFPILSSDLATNKDIHMQSSNQTFRESRAPHSVANKRGDNIQLKGRNTFAMPRNVRALGVPSINPKPAEVEDEKSQSNNEFKEMFLEFKGLHLNIFHPICGEDILNALPQS